MAIYRAYSVPLYLEALISLTQLGSRLLLFRFNKACNTRDGDGGDRRMAVAEVYRKKMRIIPSTVS